jgi:hypothetical protein
MVGEQESRVRRATRCVLSRGLVTMEFAPPSGMNVSHGSKDLLRSLAPAQDSALRALSLRTRHSICRSFATIRTGRYDLAMRFLVCGATLSSSVGEALKRHEHKVSSPEELGLTSDAEPVDILQAASKAQLDLLTTDATLAEAPFQMEKPFGRSVVYLQLEGGEVEQYDAVDRLFDRYKRLTPGRLYTVTASRVKIRQLPGHQ